MRAVLGIGVPGAGKTTLLKPLAQEHGYAYISPDEIREELSGDAADQTVNARAWSEARRRVERALASGQSVVVDATFAKRGDRVSFVRFLKAAGATDIIGAYASTALAVAQERNRVRDRVVPAAALERMAEALERHPPSVEDGFALVVPIEELASTLSA